LLKLQKKEEEKECNRVNRLKNRIGNGKLSISEDNVANHLRNLEKPT
jgi:anti-sigma28 factor (negative regulator of flagellin synthesis)